MLNINDKINSTGGADGKLTAEEYNDHKNCIQRAVEKSGQTLSAIKTPDQFARSLFLHSVSSQTFVDNSSSVNMIELTPQTGVNGYVMAETNAQLDGSIVEFYKTSANTSTTVYINIGQTTGTYIGAKPLTLINGGSMTVGAVLGYCRVKFDNVNDRWELLTSQTLLDNQIQSVTTSVSTTMIAAESVLARNADNLTSGSVPVERLTNGQTVLQKPFSGTAYDVKIKSQIYKIGTWNMTTASKTIPLGLSVSKIPISANAIVYNDAQTISYNIQGIALVSSVYVVNGSCNAFGVVASEWTLGLYSNPAGLFNSTDFDSTGLDRGYIIVTYIDV